jgi:peptide/nickel transport system permease protein
VIGFLVQRLALLFATLIVSSFAIFASLSVAPGNPIAALSGGRSLPPETVAVLEQRFNLDEPFLTRYWSWVTNALHGDFGVSIRLGQDVSDLIGAGAATTGLLVGYASLLIILFGVGAGLLAALRPGRLDLTIVAGTAVAAAIPSFVAAVALISVFAVGLGWFPAFGGGSGFADRLWHLTLPAIALAGYALALVARITRASVRDELQREHVQTATSRGIPRRLVIRRHALRNAAIPITTVLGLTIASLIAGAAVVEKAFNLNGLGAELITAAQAKDFAVVQGISLVLVVAFVLVNLATDLLRPLLDPRLHLRGRAR